MQYTSHVAQWIDSCLLSQILLGKAEISESELLKMFLAKVTFLSKIILFTFQQDSEEQV